MLRSDDVHRVTCGTHGVVTVLLAVSSRSSSEATLCSSSHAMGRIRVSGQSVPLDVCNVFIGHPAKVLIHGNQIGFGCAGLFMVTVGDHDGRDTAGRYGTDLRVAFFALPA